MATDNVFSVAIGGRHGSSGAKREEHKGGELTRAGAEGKNGASKYSTYERTDGSMGQFGSVTAAEGHGGWQWQWQWQWQRACRAVGGARAATTPHDC